MGYAFKIEVDCFELDENGYHWNLLCRKDEIPLGCWQICAIGHAKTIQEAFNEAYEVQKRYEKIKPID